MLWPNNKVVPMPPMITPIAVAIATLAAISTAANAKCSIFSYSVNDYGKEGPARDAQALLDKHIAKWAADNTLKNYTTGKKTVTCTLFLDVVLFDEYTCKADANVCWGGSVQAPAKGTLPAAAQPKAEKKPG